MTGRDGSGEIFDFRKEMALNRALGRQNVGKSFQEWFFLSLRVGFPILFSSFFTIRAQLLFSQTVKTRRKIIDLYSFFVLEEQIFQITTPFPVC